MAYPIPAGEKARVFLFEVQGVRVIGNAEQPWFVAKDVCAALDIERTDSALRGLDEDEKGAHTVSTLGGPQEMSVVNESGLYALIFRSRKAQARLFRRWVTGEVLPAIRRTGGYAVATAPAQARALPTLAPLPLALGSSEKMLCALFARVMGDHGDMTVRGVAIFAAALESGQFEGWVGRSPVEYSKRGAFFSRLRPYFGRWLEGEEAHLHYCIMPEGRGRHRRYVLSRFNRSAQTITA
jgi:prophage antirepressor-like protein